MQGSGEEALNFGLRSLSYLQIPVFSLGTELGHENRDGWASVPLLFRSDLQWRHGFIALLVYNCGRIGI